MYLALQVRHYGEVNTDSKTNSNDLMAKLNPPQRAGAEHVDGPILLLAGAGSGKTRVLTHRIANLVLNHGVNPGQILAVTFTNKAADEMKLRLRGMLGTKADYLWASTFHSACLRILRRHATSLGYSSSFVVYDDQDSKGVMKPILKELAINEKKFPPQFFLQAIDAAKNSFILPKEFEDGAKTFDQKLKSEVYHAYQKALLRANAMDFGDLLVNAVRLFQEQPEIKKLYQNSIRYILVDEFQDTNRAQYLFLQLLSAEHKNLFVVGDDDQSIYSFRGASVQNVLDFEHDYAGARVTRLEQNYRSTANILNLSHAVISKLKHRKEKKLWTDGESGELAVSFVGEDEGSEAEFVAREIKALVTKGTSLREIAIFYRTNAQSRALEESLVEAKIPYRIFGGLKFYERKEIKDILAYARLILNEQDNQAFQRVINTPPRGIGPQTLRSIAEHANSRGFSQFEAAIEIAETNTNVRGFVTLIRELQSVARRAPISELLETIIEKSEYGPTLRTGKDISSQSRIENLSELVAIGRAVELKEEEPLSVLSSFLDRVALTSSAEDPTDANSNQTPDEEVKIPNAVSLMTLHLAKGLEFEHVFLTGVEEGLLPHYRSLLDQDSLDEERRLLYVGITRAKKRVYLTRAVTRGMFSARGLSSGGGAFRTPSRFSYDMPKELIEMRGEDLSGSRYTDETEEPRRLGDGIDSEVDTEGNLVSFFERRSKRRGVKKPLGWMTADELVDENE